MKDSDLELVDTDGLVNELIHRFDHAVFVGIKDVTGDGVDATHVEYQGRNLTCLGALDYAKRFILESFMEGRNDRRKRKMR